MTNHILLTVDVEDWFQVENLRGCCPVSSWSSHEMRVERNTHRILDLLDEASLKRSAISNQHSANELMTGNQLITDNGQRITAPGQQITDNGELSPGNASPQAQRSSSEAILQPPPRIRATFFVLGWIAERLPHLVREIQTRGHEVASHGYHHDLCSQISNLELWRDIGDSKKLLEDIIGSRVYGYRAPNFSISDHILKMIAEAGYEYDSSYNSFAMHGRYGKISLNGNRRSGIAILLNQESTIENRKFYELPISNLPFSSFPILRTLGHFRHFFFPWGGGAYFRLIPAWLFTNGVKEILRQQKGYLFYLHPWEVDPEQPRPEGPTAFSRFKHYTNLSGTEPKLKSLLQKLGECRFVSCHEHLEKKDEE
jgi:peptidoglycan-N-acetylglucosamine deacetylase